MDENYSGHTLHKLLLAGPSRLSRIEQSGIPAEVQHHFNICTDPISHSSGRSSQASMTNKYVLASSYHRLMGRFVVAL